MSPIVKDPDTLETSETSVRPGSAALNNSATRPQPVALEVPITVNGARAVEGSDKREPFSEATKTVMVHGNGAVIKLTSALAPGQLLFLTNERTKKEVVCQVLKSKNYRTVSGYVELEFTESAVGFWGMRFPGDRIGPGPQAAPEPSCPAANHGSPAPSQPAEKAERPGADSASGRLRAKPSTAVPVLSKPATPALFGSSIVPAPIDSGSLLGTPKAKPDSGVPPAPLIPSFGSEEALVEPWLKKREPASRVPAEPPGVARPEPAKRTEAPAPSQPPVRNFELARPSDKPASLFAPSEPPSNPLDLSSLAPFFAVKPAHSDLAPAAPPQAPEASDREAEELKRQTARLQEELSQLGFAEEAPGMPVAPTLDAPAIPIVEPAIALLKVDPVHESAAELIENPASPGTVLPEVPKLEEPRKVEPPAPVPALESLEEAELEIPAWLRPLARNASLPPPANELVPRERAKRVREQPQLEELMAPLAAPSKDAKAAPSHVPQFGNALPFQGAKKIEEKAHSGKGMLCLALVAGIVLVAAGAWWYKNQRSGGVLARTSARKAPAPFATSQDTQTNSAKEAALAAMLPPHNDSATAAANPDRSNANVPANAAPGSATDGEAARPEAVPSEVKKPVLGEVHLEAPKLSGKRAAQNSVEPDLREEPSAEDGADLGAPLGVSGKQPAAPAAQLPVGGEVNQARLISSVPPAYPAMAKAQHVSGAVTIDALVDASGRVAKMKVLSGPTLLEQAAMEALRQWKYEPATLDGKAVPMHLTVTIQFRLQR